jgi:hypothetical protein
MWAEIETTIIGRSERRDWTRLQDYENLLVCQANISRGVDQVEKVLAGTWSKEMDLPSDLKASKSTEVKRGATGVMAIIRTESLIVFQSANVSCLPWDYDPRVRR